MSPNSKTEEAINELRKKIALGIEQADRGLFVDGPSVFARLRQRSTELNPSPDS